MTSRPHVFTVRTSDDRLLASILIGGTPTGGTPTGGTPTGRPP